MNKGLPILLILAASLHLPSYADELIQKHYRSVKVREVIGGKVFVRSIMEELPDTKSPLAVKAPDLAAKKAPGNDQQNTGGILVQDNGCHHRLVVGTDTLFEFDKATLTPEAEKTLKLLGPMIQRYGQHPARVQGHTDSIGTDEYNHDLSIKRAETVKTWLVEHEYTTDSQMEIEGFGESRPVAPNTYTDGTDYPQGRLKNRRVELLVDTCR